MQARHDAVFEKVMSDSGLLIRTCFKVVDGDSQKTVPFIFREEQDHYWKNKTLCDEILKPRKRGFSSLIDAEFLCACILQKHTHAVVIAHRDEDTEILFQRVRWMKDNLPFSVPIKSEGAGHMYFPQTESDFRVITARGMDPGRGRDITHLHLSERAFYPDENFLAAVEGACVKNARRVIETTANGSGTPFHKHWLKSSRGETAYKTHFYPWWFSKDYEIEPPVGSLGNYDESERKLKEAYNLSDRKLAWRRRKIREMSNPDLFDQEFPHSAEVAFLVSGRMVFDWVAIQKQAAAAAAIKWRGHLKNTGHKVELMPAQDGPLKIWVMPRESSRYVLAADIAEGLPDGAWSVCDVIDVSTWEQVAQWRGHCTPMEFADILGDLGAFYNWGLVVPEVNNHGLATCARLVDQGYSNLYSRAEKSDGVDYGWLTTTKTKIMMVNALAHALKNLDIKINSEATLEELKSFVYLETRDKMGPQAGVFSDTVMSLAIGAAILGDLRETPMTQRQRFREALGVGARYKKLSGQPTATGYGVRRE